MLVVLRSLLFLILFYSYMFIMCILCLPFLLLPRHIFRHVAKVWVSGCMILCRYVAGLNYKIIGKENLPAPGVILAVKHQSAWETLAMHYLHFDSAYVLKKELLSIPLFGRYLSKMNCVAVDRKAGASALKDMVKQSRIVLDDDRSLVIFPQGTRTAPGEARPYHPGIAGVYSQNRVAVVPVALNSGQFWGRNAFKKTPGTITIAYLDPIQPGLAKGEFMNLLKARIETSSTRIEAEVVTKRGF